MTMTSDTESTFDTATRFEADTPFAETSPPPLTAETAMQFTPWAESFSPFAETAMVGGAPQSESEALMAEAFAELRDESFDEALAELVAETAEAADQRLAGESATQLTSERERLAEAHLTPIGFEAEQCVSRLSEGLAGIDLESLSSQQLDEVLARFDRVPAGLSLAGEEFIGGLIKKAKNVVKSVVKAAGTVAKAAAGPIIGPILNKLKALIRPLLRRVLAMAINKLPAALHAPARALAGRIGLGEAEAEAEAEAGEAQVASPVAAGDPEMLAESFDAALAESVLGGAELEQGESFGHAPDRGETVAGTQLESLAEARGQLMQQLQGAADGEDLTPAMEQFIPAILPALRLGLKLVGRPRVVGFLARYLAQLIGKWVGPTNAGPLSSAIVDVGLRLVGLEQAAPGELEQEAAPALLAATVEDTVRRLSEAGEHVFEDEDLLQMAVGEAFEEAVAANFPAQLVRPDLQIAPTLGGSFVLRHARQPFAYKKFSRTPEVEVTDAVAGAIRTFRGVTLAAALKARGVKLPMRFRVHIYEATAGTTLPRLARMERVPGLGAGNRMAWSQLHPLTNRSAGLLLREPRLGVRTPAAFLRSRHKIAVGQRFFYLEPIGSAASGAGTVVPAPVAGAATGGPCDASPSAGRMSMNLAKSEVVVTLFRSEADAQAMAASLTTGRGGHGLLKALTKAFDELCRSMGQANGAVQIVGEAAVTPPAATTTRLAPVVLNALRQKLRGWVARALAEWARARAQEFVRAAQDPACGVTVTVTLSGVPGLATLRTALAGELGATGGAASSPDTFSGTPNVTITVAAGAPRS